MQEEMQTVIQKVLPAVLEDAAKAREMNSKLPISGERFSLPLKGRNIEIAYYRAPGEHAPLLVGMHGGGFLFGGSAMDDDLWKNVTACLDVNVASVNYRMSPDYKDYDCLWDCYDSTVYLAEHAEEFGFDPAHISVFGCSAGGNLAAAAALLAKSRGELQLDNQILIYPFLDGATDPDEKGEGSFSGMLPHIMNQLHFSPDKADDPLLSPYYASGEMLEGLPKAIVVYCENDNLRAEAEVYCRHLRDAGTEVAEMLAEKMPHGFIESGFKKHLNDMERGMLGPDAEELVQSGLLRQTSCSALEFIRKEMIR